MQPGEVTGLHYLVPSSSSSPYPPHFSMSTQSNTTPFQFNRFSSPLYNIQFPNSHLQEINNPQQPSSFSSNSTSDEADEHQLSLINERKQRRMISNRESARRSQSHDKVLQENAQLKEQASDLRQMLTDLQLHSPYHPALRDLEDVPCNTAYLRSESSNQSITSSMDLLG
ncbi:hypothetical protein GBA52_011540 [Prunus armeniaca]|nr:hypothetical protein GBA52_011540 [Prunus armeniaca]